MEDGGSGKRISVLVQRVDHVRIWTPVELAKMGYVFMWMMELVWVLIELEASGIEFVKCESVRPWREENWRRCGWEESVTQVYRENVSHSSLDGSTLRQFVSSHPLTQAQEVSWASARTMRTFYQ